MATAQRFTLGLFGPFRLLKPGGERVEIPSKKGVAVVAMLAMARDGERTRSWLQDRLWGKRQQTEARGSLRRELSNLRKLLNHDTQLLVTGRDRVTLNLELIDVDARRALAHPLPGEFLEGLDIAGEDGFEEWLREQRRLLTRTALTQSKPFSESSPRPASDTPTSASLLPLHIVDTSQPPIGFEGSSALAVLPFLNMIGDEQYDYIAEGISEELIERLSRIRWLPVISRSSSFSFSDATDRRTVSKSLGARYLLEGRLRRDRDTPLIVASLIDGTNGHTVWTQRFILPSLTSKNSFDQFVAELVASLEARVDHAEQMRTRGKRQDNFTVNDLIWRGRWHLNRLTKTDSEMAQKLFAEALALDPTSSEALLQSTFALGWAIWAGRQPKDRVYEMRKLAQDAIYADRDDGRGYMLAGIAEMWLRHPLAAQELLQQAIALNPSLSMAHAQLGGSFNLTGQPEQAIIHLQAALRLNSNDLQNFYALTELALAFSMLGKWSKAIEHADHALALRPAYWYAHVIKVNALARTGELSAARDALEELLLLKPDFSKRFIDWLPFVDSKWTSYLVEGLKLVPIERSAWLENDDQSRTA
ncbi:tetratricopeptide repeat protein [Bradyrhizobium erythrophlei]|uniref:tetratricopeptide repeat protein n=1 Tax=Bradyrhizobium erythrophlei TaxID=1437360 RepID=UPI0035EBA847